MRPLGEPETEWHRNWKNHFPVEWQEIVHRAEDGEKHIADVKADKERVIEFQYSHLNPQERRAREAFYGPMDWVVSGLRRKRDKPSFYEGINALRPYAIIQRVPCYKLLSEECAVLRNWAGSARDVFFDFGAAEEDAARFGEPILWHRCEKSGWMGDLNPGA